MLLRRRFILSNLRINNLHTIPLGNTEHLKDVIRLPIIHHHGYVCNLPPEHRFPMKKFHKVYEILISSGIVTEPSQILVPYKLNKNLALLVHTEDYTENFFNGTTTTEEQRVTGFTWTPDLLSRVQYECGGTVLSAIIALEIGLACSTAGGTHHAFPDHGAGFCLLNDIAIAAQFLFMAKKAQKVLIVDLDVHQGDGTAFIFRNTDKVFTFSMHCGKNFPFRKQVSDLDIDLNVGTEDKEYMIHLAEHLPSILDTYRPDIVLYDAGVDPHVHDDLGKLNLSDEGLFRRDLFVLTNVLQRGIPCATVIGGGYCHDIDTLAKRHTIIHHAANKVWNRIGL